MQLEPRLSDEIIPDLNNIVRAIEDEGDRCYLGSTNDADRLREIANWLDTKFRRTPPASQSDEVVFPVGSLTLKPGYNPGTTWIVQRGGEGGEFPTEEIEAVLQAYYKERF